MKEYFEHLEEFSSEAYLPGSRMPRSQWGNKEIAEKYLEKYWLPRAEYERSWKPIQDNIYINQQRGLPDIGFREGFKIFPLRGGVVFIQEYLENLQSCIQHTHDKFFVIIENLYGKQFVGKLPPFMMKYPADISWQELMSGNFISSILFEWPRNEYFVFGDSGKWGEYIANDYKLPLNIVAFREEYAHIFREKFKVSQEEWLEILGWLPPEYEKYL
ncbi:MAG: hypothetical protein HY277_00070 [Ignavibacteriales bacterium]|nr:hypothetical protein [Ignavibacteriales bacterium]